MLQPFEKGCVKRKIDGEWKISYLWLLSGLFSSIMRELANITHDGPKWILLDGDIDPMWIESLNTVMDDNKVLRGKGNFHGTPTHL